jgi:predicted amidohydrolase
MDRLICAAVQMTSTEDVARNIERADALCRRAASRGAGFIALPECFGFLSENESKPPAEAVQDPGPQLRFGRETSKALSAYLLLGSVPEKIPGEERVYNTSFLFDPAGEVIARYRKIHLFDVSVAGKEYRESSRCAPGSTPVVAETAFGLLGLSICYDVRFPELYRALSQKGATILSIPAAFTLMTGKDHWEVLLRARAIENQAFVIAAAQSGKHGNWRMSYGHSMIIDPWGLVLARSQDGEGIAVTEIDFKAQEKMRAELPALRHRVL